MLIREVALYLQSLGQGTFGVNLSLGWEPPSPDSSLTLYDTGGYPSESALPDLRRTLQVRVRDRDYPAGHARIWAAFNALDRPENRVLVTPGGSRLRCRALQPPRAIGQDANGRWLFVFNLEVMASRD